jgi:hypothetical protein
MKMRWHVRKRFSFFRQPYYASCRTSGKWRRPRY